MGEISMLLVDDDFHVLQGLQNNIDWDQLGVKHVFQAIGVRSAKEILIHNEINLLICDIEMPSENGFDLLEWIKNRGIIITTMLLTSFGYFEYAQKAIHYQIYEYILKPVDYNKLMASIRGAIKRQREIDNTILLRSRSNAISSNLIQAKELIWQKILNGIYDINDGKIKEKISLSGMDYIYDSLFLMVIAQPIQHITDDMKVPEWGKILCNDENPLLLECSLRNFHGQYVYIFRGNSLLGQSVYGKHLIFSLKNLIFEEQFHSFYIYDSWRTIFSLVKEYNFIRPIILNLPQKDSCIYEADNCLHYISDYIKPDLHIYYTLLCDNNFESFSKCISKEIQKMDEGESLTSNNLKKLCIDINQVIYSYLRDNNIYAHEAFKYEETLYEDKKFISKEDAVFYINSLLIRTQECVSSIKEPHNVINKVKTYIDNNYTKEISREELGKIAFLNQDYLSKLFKKETGCSINGYITAKRINKAIILLTSTNNPVNVISSQVGYENFAYFSKVFKDKMGCSPNEYRKKHKNIN